MTAHLAVVVLLAALVVVLLRSVHSIQSAGFSDLAVYRGSIHAWWHDHGLYRYHDRFGFPFTYPPFAAIVLAPLAWLALRAAGDLLAVAALVGCAPAAVLLLDAARRRPRPTRMWGLAFPVAAALLALAFARTIGVESNIRYGQISFFVALAVFTDVFARPMPQRWRGVLTGLAAAVKLTPLAFIVWWWITGRRRIAIRAALVAAGATIAAAIVLPHETLWYGTKGVFDTRRIGVLAHAGNQSIRGVLERAWGQGTAATVVSGLLATVVLVVALARAKRLARAGDDLASVAVLGAGVVLASPVAWTHHLAWLLPAVVALLTDRRAVAVAFGGLLLACLWWSPADLLGHLGVSPFGWAIDVRAYLAAVCLFAVGTVRVQTARVH